MAKTITKKVTTTEYSFDSSGRMTKQVVTELIEQTEEKERSSNGQ